MLYIFIDKDKYINKSCFVIFLLTETNIFQQKKQQKFSEYQFFPDMCFCFYVRSVDIYVYNFLISMYIMSLIIFLLSLLSHFCCVRSLIIIMGGGDMHTKKIDLFPAKKLPKYSQNIQCLP